MPERERTTWRYVDEGRTHEVRAWLATAQPLDFVVEERVPGTDDPSERYTTKRIVQDRWETKAHVLALEKRLVSLGTYFRQEPTGWVRMKSQPATLEPLELGAGEVIEFHHYEGEGRHAVTLAALHQPTPKGRRTALTRLDYLFPDTTGGNLQVLHLALPPGVYRSALAAQHAELLELRFRRLPARADLAMDGRTWAALQASLDAILGRLSSIEALDVPAGKMDLKQLVEVAQAKRKAEGAASRGRDYDVEFEMDASAAGPAGKPPEVLMEELDGDVVKALYAPKLLALHERMLPPGEEQRLMAAGPREIGHVIKGMREKMRPDEQHLVSLLEASLLLRHALAKRSRIDPEVIRRVRTAAAFL